MVARRTILGIAIVCLYATVRPSYGQHGPEPIRWRSQPANSPQAAAGAAKSPADLLTASNNRHMVVQFNALPGRAERAQLQASGVTLLRYLGNNAYFARVNGAKGAGKAASAAGLHAAFDVGHEAKLHPKLVRGEIPPFARIPAAIAHPPAANGAKPVAAQEDMLALYVVFHPDVDLAKAGVATVARHGGTIRCLIRSINGAVIWLPAGKLTDLAQEDEIQWIEPPLPPVSVTNDSNRQITQAEQIQAPPYGLSGAGIDVLVYDGGTGLASHPDFGGRLSVRDNSGLDDHPTHVAGTIGGNGATSAGRYRGMAPQVTIEAFGFQYDGTGQFLYTNPGDIEADYDKAINTFGAVLANNSIGTNVAANYMSCDLEGDYGVTDMLIDAIVTGSLGAPMRVIWANGNERGSGRCGTGYHTTAPPACAKNHITVGAVNSNDGTMTAFSSWGPTDDGRLKPDVCAPGCQTNDDNGVTSTVASGGYGVMCGTSMAAPTVTGLVALLLEDWKVQFPGQPLPPNAMVKTLLVHNANDLGNPGPDYQFGYGSVRIQDTVDFMRTHNFSQGSAGNGDQAMFVVPVTDPNVPLKVTLAWDDVPGTVNTVPELVNDLDLQLVAPDGTAYYPWTLDPNNPAAPAVRTKPDRVNNIEQVIVDQPVAGIWTAIVTGFAVPSGSQAFSLAASPSLQACSSTGKLLLDSPKYSCSDTVRITLNDCDLNTNPNTIQTATVTVASSSQPGGFPVTLTETNPGSATCVGTFQTAPSVQSGRLMVANNDTITVTYLDANDGQGHTNVNVIATAPVDCAGPVISSVQATNLTASAADIVLITSEPARVQVRYGTACGALTTTVANRPYALSHTLSLTGLTKNMQYFFVVDADDEAGNRTTADNLGQCFTFTTADRQDFFTQLFDSHNFDLDGKALTFTPNANIHKYSLCLDTISALPASTQNATQLSSLRDDDYALITLTGGNTVSLYGVAYNSFYVGSNGYITFTAGDVEYTETLAHHFRLPRISAMFHDFKTKSGKVTWRQLSDRVAVTWDHLPEYATTNASTFQVVMHFDGTIEIAWLGVAATNGLVGLSEGLGVPSGFQMDDLSTSTTCFGPPPKAFDPFPNHNDANAPLQPTLSWSSNCRATTHELYFDTVLICSCTQPSFALPRLTNNSTHSWRVDELNAAGRTTGDVWTFTVKPFRPDFDHDGDVDMTDFAHLQLCLSGTNVPQNDPNCQDARLDGDTDVDADDAALFSACLGGAGQPADPACYP